MSKTHGSSFGTSAVKVVFSFGVYFQFKVQLSIKWHFFSLKNSTLQASSLDCHFIEGLLSQTDGAIGEHGGYTR